MGDVGSKTRSVDQIMEKPCEHSRGHSFGQIFIKLVQNDHLDNTFVKSEYGSCRVRNEVSRSNLHKNLVNTPEATVLVQFHQTLSRWNMDHVRSKTRSVGKIMEKPCEHSRGHSFGPIFIKLGQDQIWIILGQKVGQ